MLGFRATLGFKAGRTARPLKKNPLRTWAPLLKLNPYAKTARRMELMMEVRFPMRPRIGF